MARIMNLKKNVGKTGGREKREKYQPLKSERAPGTSTPPGKCRDGEQRGLSRDLSGSDSSPDFHSLLLSISIHSHVET